MPKVNNIVKRKRGRPSTIKDGEFVGLRVPKLLLDQIELWAKQNKTDRSAAIRMLLERSLTKE